MKTISAAGVPTRRSTRPPVQQGLSEVEAARRLAVRGPAPKHSSTLAGRTIAIAGLAVTDDRFAPGRAHTPAPYGKPAGDSASSPMAHRAVGMTLGVNGREES
jgi:hypothetical protein